LSAACPNKEDDSFSLITIFPDWFMAGFPLGFLLRFPMGIAMRFALTLPFWRVVDFPLGFLGCCFPGVIPGSPFFIAASSGLAGDTGVPGTSEAVCKGCGYVGTHGQGNLFPEQGAAFMQDGDVRRHPEFIHDLVDQVLHGLASSFFDGFV
jgi:hypothetical protein